MTQMVDDEKKYIENKKFYLDESKKVWENEFFWWKELKIIQQCQRKK